MQLSKINNQNFGATPNALTMHFLQQLGKKDIKTAPITNLMRNIYVGSNVTSRAFSDGSIIVDMYNKQGDFFAKLIDTSAGITADRGTLALKDPKLYAKKLYAALAKLAKDRTAEQKIADDLLRPVV